MPNITVVDQASVIMVKVTDESGTTENVQIRLADQAFPKRSTLLATITADGQVLVAAFEGAAELVADGFFTEAFVSGVVDAVAHRRKLLDAVTALDENVAGNMGGSTRRS